MQMITREHTLKMGEMDIPPRSLTAITYLSKLWIAPVSNFQLSSLIPLIRNRINSLVHLIVNTVVIFRPILHKYANEDVSLGAWLIGLEVEHIDDRSLCCGTPPG